jgi:hypothetical protein
MLFVKEILRLPTELEKDFITFAKIKVENKMATKKIDNSVKGRLKQAEKEWGDIFAEVQYGAPVDVLLKNNTDAVTADVIAKKDAEAAKKMQSVVLHLYHTLGLTVSQIAGTVDMSIDSVQNIINTHKE